MPVVMAPCERASTQPQQTKTFNDDNDDDDDDDDNNNDNNSHR